MSGLIGDFDVNREGTRIGNLTVTENGLMTVFNCECDYRFDGILRLAGVSGGEYRKIGVLTPENGVLKLTKSYTKNALAGLSLEADAGFYAIADREQYEGVESTAARETQSVPELPVEPPAKPPVVAPAKPPAKAPAKPPVEVPVESVAVEPEKKPGPPTESPRPGPAVMEPKPAGEWRPVADASALFEDPDISVACRGIKGAMTAVRGEITLLAVPVVPGVPFPMMPVFCFGDSIMLEGREYIVFKSKNGNLVI